MKARTAVFDARWILAAPSGIGVYAEALATRLPALLPDWKFVFAIRADASAALADRLAGAAPGLAEVVRLAHAPLSPRGALELRRLVSERGAELVHSPNFSLPQPRFGFPGRRVREIATIHDVIPLVVPDYAPASRTSRLRPVFRACLRATARRADVLFTVSERSKRDIVSALRLSPREAARVRAVPNGVSPAFGAATHVPVKASADRAERVVLYVGRRDPYKNVPLLVSAFAEACAKAPWPMRLVLAGSPDPRYPEAEALARSLGVSDRVESVGSLPFSNLVERYRTADLLVHPSRYEGFGLQVAEAFASGLPVVCSDGGSLPEIVGGAARVVSSSAGAEEWARAMLGALSDPAALARMRDAGRERARLFSWERAAAAVAAAYGEDGSAPEGRAGE